MFKKIVSLLLVVVMTFSAAAFVFAEEEVAITDESHKAYDVSLAVLNSAYEYLNEVYLNSDLGYTIEYATNEDIETLTKLSNYITAGCSTDAEKCEAIYNWVKSNVNVSFGSYAPIDVFRNLNGVCSGHAQLMSALFKLAGINSAVVRGHKANTNYITMERVYNNSLDSHQWTMAYHDNDWYVYDDLWNECGNNNKEDIASKYYLLHVDGVVPYTEEIKFGSGEYKGVVQTVYKDGQFIGMCNGETITNQNSASLSMGGCLRYNKCYYNNSTKYYYTCLTNTNTTYGYALAGGYYEYGGVSINYIKLNGINLESSVINYNNTSYLTNNRLSCIIDSEIDNNGLSNGKLNMYIGETIDLSDLYEDGTIITTFSKCLSVTDGIITAVSKGQGEVYINNGSGSLAITVYGDVINSTDTFKAFCDHDCTHCVLGEEYCDYCGQLIESVEEETSEEEIVEETPNEETLEEEVHEEETEIIEEVPEVVEEEITEPELNETIEYEEPAIEEETEIATPTNIEEVLNEESTEETVVEEPSNNEDSVEDNEVNLECPTIEEPETIANIESPVINETPTLTETPAQEVEEEVVNEVVPDIDNEVLEEAVEEELPTVSNSTYEPEVTEISGENYIIINNDDKITKDNLSIKVVSNNNRYYFGNNSGEYSVNIYVINIGSEDIDIEWLFSLDELQDFLVEILNLIKDDDIQHYNLIMWIYMY